MLSWILAEQWFFPELCSYPLFLASQPWTGVGLSDSVFVNESVGISFFVFSTTINLLKKSVKKQTVWNKKVSVWIGPNFYVPPQLLVEKYLALFELKTLELRQILPQEPPMHLL